MKKTPIAGPFTKQIIRANDQICFAALQQWEFARRLGPLAVASPKKFTKDIFPANPFAAAINRKGDELPSFSREAEEVALQMGVIAAMEYVIAYIEDVQLFREKLVGSDGEAVRNDAEEEQLRLKLSLWRGSQPTIGYFWNLGYFRLLRNHYAHVNEEPNPSFKTYIRSHGTPLNSFWNNGRTDVHGIDFRTLPSVRLVPDLAFGIMNLLRVSVQHVDHMIADTLSLADAVRWTISQIRAAPAGRQLSVERLSSKVTKRLGMEWNIDEPLSAVLSQVQIVVSGTV